MISDEEIDEALREAAQQPPYSVAVEASYLADADVVVIRLNNGRRLAIPREELQGLERATELELATIVIRAGRHIGWTLIDVNHYLPSLMEGRYGSAEWMIALRERWDRALAKKWASDHEHTSIAA